MCRSSRARLEFSEEAVQPWRASRSVKNIDVSIEKQAQDSESNVSANKQRFGLVLMPQVTTLWQASETVGVEDMEWCKACGQELTCLLGRLFTIRHTRHV